MKKITPIILAGGSGMRLWPMSRKDMPKQFLSLVAEESTYQATLRRVSNNERFSAPVVITNEEHRFHAASQAASIGVDVSLLLEPMSRDSGPAIAAAVSFVQSRDGEKTLVLVLAADHIILDAIRRHVPESEFDSALNDLVLAARARGGESMAQVVRSAFEQRGFAVEGTDVEAGIPGSVELSMWPQPAQDRLRLSWSIVSDQAPSIRVFDGLGREHHVDAKVSGASADLDLSRMTSGWYLVVIESRLGRTARPLIISK